MIPSFLHFLAMLWLETPKHLPEQKQCQGKVFGVLTAHCCILG